MIELIYDKKLHIKKGEGNVENLEWLWQEDRKKKDKTVYQLAWIEK